MFRLSEWILKHRSASLAIFIAVVVLTFTILNPQWWGDRALGVWIGSVSLVVVFIAFAYLIDKFDVDLEFEQVGPWVLLIIATGTALIVRRTSGVKLIWPIQFHTPAVPSPQSLFLILIAILFVMLLVVFVRALNRGEGIGIESHWGGLGGGIGGWQLSAPLIYLLGIVLLLAVSSAIAWRIFTPPPTQQSQEQRQTSSQTNSNDSSSTSSPTQSPAQSPSPSP